MWFWLSVSLRLHRFAPEKVGQVWAQSQIFLPVKLVFLVLSPDPLRSGQGRGHPLQYHRSRRGSAPQRDLQHRSHQWQHVCDPTPRQGGESLVPCKEEFGVSASPLFHLCLIISQSSLWKCAPPPPRTVHSNTSAFCWTTTSWSAFRRLPALCGTFTSAPLGSDWCWSQQSNDESLGKTHDPFNCHLDWSLDAESGARQIKQTEGGRSEVEGGKTVVFVLSIRANEQVQLQVCLCASKKYVYVCPCTAW